MVHLDLGHSWPMTAQIWTLNRDLASGLVEKLLSTK